MGKKGDERSVKRELARLGEKNLARRVPRAWFLLAFPLGSQDTNLSPLTLPLYPKDCPLAKGINPSCVYIAGHPWDLKGLEACGPCSNSDDFPLTPGRQALRRR